MSKTMTIRPRLSEKAYGQSKSNVYVFDVPSGVGKLEIASAVEGQFGVSVLTVNTANIKGKLKRTIRRGGRQTYGKRNDVKKAYVTLKEGDSIPVFAAVEEAEKEAAKQAAKEKK
jgi:large subunit ribosomal protein L23